MLILLITPFKVASSSLEHTIKNLGIKIVKIHGWGDKENQLYNLNEFTHIITIFREPIKIYMSALFQDIICPEYPYYFGDKHKVLNTQKRLLNILLNFLGLNMNG